MHITEFINQLKNTKDDTEWKLAVDHELTIMHSTADSYGSPMEAVRALIDWNVAVATDPAVNGQQRGELDLGKAIEADRQRIRESVAYGPFDVTFMGPGVWAGIPDELPPELVGKQVYISIASQPVELSPKFGEEQ